MPKLLPCPFCASSGDALITNSKTVFPEGGKSYKLWWVHCTHCQCTGPRPNPTRAVAIEEWNGRRTEPWVFPPIPKEKP